MTTDKMQCKSVIIDTLQISYLDSDSRDPRKPVVLLLHGWGDNKTTFTPILRNLLSSYRVIALDLPGFGGSDLPKETFDLDKYAIFVKSFLQKTQISKPYVVLGHSNGGAIAIKALAEKYIDADMLILLASSGVRSTYKGRKKALRLLAKTVKMPVMLLPHNIQTRLKKKAYHAIGSDLFVAEGLQETFKKVVNEDLVAISAKVAVPTLLIYGSIDMATPVTYGQSFAEMIKGSKLIVINEAGHFLHQTHSAIVAKHIGKFLEAKE